MMTSMIHRGPDDGGFETFSLAGGGSGALGFRRLAIIDRTLSGHQPMVHPSTGDMLVFNGEIYNYRQLRAELVAAGACFRGESDTEVLLHALTVFGPAVLGRLHGMYALAFFRASDRKVLLARDPLGIKPLYVGRTARGVVFASEVRALLASGECPLDLDPAGIAGMLAYGAVQSPRTVFSRVRSFPAGHFQWIDTGDLATFGEARQRRFWSYPSVATAPAPDAPGVVRFLRGVDRSTGDAAGDPGRGGAPILGVLPRPSRIDPLVAAPGLGRPGQLRGITRGPGRGGRGLNRRDRRRVARVRAGR